MNNEERIRQWRERQSGMVPSAAPSTSTNDLARAASLLDQPAVLSPEQLFEALRAATQGLPAGDTAVRREIYKGLTRDVEEAAKAGGLSSTAIDLRVRQLRMASRLFEMSLRERGAPTEELPPGFRDALERVTASFDVRFRREEEENVRRARRQSALTGQAFQIALPADEAADLRQIRQRLAFLDVADGLRHLQPQASSPRTLLAVFRYQFELLQSESRVAILWAFVGPVVLLALISAIYLLSGTRHILGMDVPTFAMIGATAWIMFRNVLLRTSQAMSSQRSLLNLQAVSSLTVGIAQGLIYLLIFHVVFLVLIVGGSALGIFTAPDDPWRFWPWITGMGAAGIAVGLFFGAVAFIYPYFLRVAPVLERAVELFSGVFFISEQLPEEYRPYVLWSPFTHAMQSMRSGYFASYESSDAQGRYFILWLGIMIVAALVTYRAVRSRKQPV